MWYLKKVSVNLLGQKTFRKKIVQHIFSFDEWYESASLYRRFELSVGWGGGVGFTTSMYADE